MRSTRVSVFKAELGVHSVSHSVVFTETYERKQRGEKNLQTITTVIFLSGRKVSNNSRR